MDITTLLTGIIIFFARILDVSFGTIRTIAIVQGKTISAFFLGFFEIIIWISVVSTVVHRMKDSPLLVVFYASGFATGNVVGIIAERKLAFGMTQLRVISRTKGVELANIIRQIGQAVTIFEGQGMTGPVHELYIACRRRDLKVILPIVKREDPNAFYIVEQARDVSKVLHPVSQQVTGWRSRMKKK